MDVVNFAHGELFMLGAYIGVIVLAATGSFWLALILASLIVALLGAAMQIVTLRPLIGRDPLTTILATFGMSLILQNYALWQFGPSSRKINEPITTHFNLFYLEYPWYRLVIAALSAAIIGSFYLTNHQGRQWPPGGGGGKVQQKEWQWEALAHGLLAAGDMAARTNGIMLEACGQP